jgi:hypothetical protein
MEKIEEKMNQGNKKKKTNEEEQELLLGNGPKVTNMPQKERQIREEEFKKSQINQILASKLGDHLESSQIKL